MTVRTRVAKLERKVPPPEPDADAAQRAFLMAVKLASLPLGTLQAYMARAEANGWEPDPRPTHQRPIDIKALIALIPDAAKPGILATLAEAKTVAPADRAAFLRDLRAQRASEVLQRLGDATSP
jgi:hypothetical protein